MVGSERCELDLFLFNSGPINGLVGNRGEFHLDVPFLDVIIHLLNITEVLLQVETVL